MYDFNYPEELKAARRQLDHLHLRVRMYENKAINDEPKMFEHWCDLIDRTNAEIERQARHLLIADLTWKRDMIRDQTSPGLDYCRSICPDRAADLFPTLRDV